MLQKNVALFYTDCKVFSNSFSWVWFQIHKVTLFFSFHTNQAQNRTTYYAPNQLAQMRPNPRWQQQGGRGQGECELTACFHSKMYTLMYRMFELHQLLSPSGGFQGMPSSLRQPGPRASLRHMTPNSGTQGPRGVFNSMVLLWQKCLEVIVDIWQFQTIGLSGKKWGLR